MLVIAEKMEMTLQTRMDSKLHDRLIMSKQTDQNVLDLFVREKAAERETAPAMQISTFVQKK